MEIFRTPTCELLQHMDLPSIKSLRSTCRQAAAVISKGVVAEFWRHWIEDSRIYWCSLIFELDHDHQTHFGCVLHWLKMMLNAELKVQGNVQSALTSVGFIQIRMFAQCHLRRLSTCADS